MFNPFNPRSGPLTVQQVVQNFRLTGWIGLWTQVALGAVSGAILLFAQVTQTGSGDQGATPGSGFGLVLAGLGLLPLGVGIFWFYRYVGIAKQLASGGSPARPRPGVVQDLKIGLGVSIAGLLITTIGAEAIMGTLAAKSLTQAAGAVLNPVQGSLIRPVDIFVAQANTNTSLAHLVGLVCSLWLLQVVYTPRSHE